jgi:hypothetical protein
MPSANFIEIESDPMFIAESPVKFGTGVGLSVRATSSISSRFDAGSVLTISTRNPPSARPMAVAHAREVLPTPPLPVKKRNGVGAFRTRK